jgi:hypothetical protein
LAEGYLQLTDMSGRMVTIARGLRRRRRRT